jgi:aminoglycoside 3-N-acetyltransferase
MTIQLLVEEWRKAGVDSGDVLLVHSSIKRTLLKYAEVRDALSPKDIVQSFLDAVGPLGTLVFPTFNFDFTAGVPFHIQETPSQMGALTEVARLRPDAKRSGHPIYSFVAIGKYAGRFEAINNVSGYGADSPFALLRELDGKIAVLDLPDQKSMTFYHHVEEMHEVDYRFHKTFIGKYTDAGGKMQERSYGIYVRNIEQGVETHVDPAGELMWQNGLYVGDRPLIGSGLRIVRARQMYDFVSEIISSGRAENLLFRRDTR